MSLDEQLKALDNVTRYCSEPFRALCRERFLAGHGQYGDAWAARDNVAEALLEAADGANYAAMAMLNGERTLPIVQAATMHAYYAWRTLHTGQLCMGEIGRAIAKALPKADMVPDEALALAVDMVHDEASALAADMAPYEALALAGKLTKTSVVAFRRACGLTRAHMAEVLGLAHPVTVSAYEHGDLPLGPTAQTRYLQAIRAIRGASTIYSATARAFRAMKAP